MLTVLHIDDDPGFRLLLREIATEQGEAGGLQWLEASGVQEALAHHAAARPDLIFLDNRLGLEDGVQLLPRVVEAFCCPVWLLSGVLTDRLEEQARRGGAAGIATKDELLEAPTRLASLLRGAATTASGSASRS